MLAEQNLIWRAREGRKLTPTTQDAEYVHIVKRGIEENYKREMREANLKASLARALIGLEIQTVLWSSWRGYF